MNVRAFILTALTLPVAAMFSVPASAQTLGEKYQTPEPRTCASKAEPQNGAISDDQAAAYIVCDQEYEEDGNTLHLVSNVAVQVGGGTPYGSLPENSRPADGDSSGIVYNIQGSLDLYACSVPSAFTPSGQQCFLTEEPQAVGRCYRTTSGDWFCSMAELGTGYPAVSGPPTSP